jgi:hypothetical protein
MGVGAIAYLILGTASVRRQVAKQNELLGTN